MKKAKKLCLLSFSVALTLSLAFTTLPKHTEALAVGFKDISKENPYYEIINEMGRQGIISGYEDGTFRPNEIITRKHMASLVSRAIGKDMPQHLEPMEYKDISKSNPNYIDIKRIQQAGVFLPDSRGNFNPDDYVRRYEMAILLTIVFDLQEKANYDFPDVPESHPENYFVRALYSNGITTGDNGYFYPYEPVTRAQFALFMYRAMNMDPNYVAKPIVQVKEINKQESTIKEDPRYPFPKGWTPPTVGDARYTKDTAANYRLLAEKLGLSDVHKKGALYKPDGTPRSALMVGSEDELVRIQINYFHGGKTHPDFNKVPYVTQEIMKFYELDGIYETVEATIRTGKAKNFDKTLTSKNRKVEMWGTDSGTMVIRVHHPKK